MVTVSVKMEESLKEAMNKYAQEHDLSASWVIRKALTEFLNKNNNDNKE